MSLLLALLGTAQAQQQEPIPNVQRFQPTGSMQGFATVPSARQLPQKGFGFDAIFQYAHRPFQRSTIENGILIRQEGAIDGLFAAHLRLGLGVHDMLEFSVDAPVFQYTTTAAALTDFGGTDGSAGFGDIQISASFRPLSEESVGFALAPFVTVPTGTADTFLTHGVVTFGGRAILSKTAGPVHLAANGGYRYFPSGGFVGAGSVAVDDEVLYGAGIGFILIQDRLRLNVEATGGAIVGAARQVVLNEEFKGALHTPLEVLGDFRIDTGSGLGFLVGAGPGVTPAVGTPTFRVFGSVGWRPPTVRDRDGDGILDNVDDCPDDPEDFDQFQDEDGCPEFDNDGDGIADMVDNCPNDPEDFDQFQDPDGCPDPDNDQDRILDVNDACPMQPEDYDGIEDQDGCPEDDPDTDGDGIPDSIDQCPLDPEDIDSFQDADGCPDPDNDQDTILDVVDLCPLDPENFNGVKDEDGCPDDQKVVVTKDRIYILDKVLFYTAKAKIVEKSFPILEAVLQTLQDNPQIRRIRIEGHTDSRGSDSYNLELSNKRAKAVEAFLIERGIDAERLEAEGFGELSPLVPNDSSSNMEKNRRVEFHILKQE